MKKNLPFFLLFLFFPLVSLSQENADFEDAFAAVRNMRVGWNLGNTLDCNSGDTLNMWIEHWTSRQPADYEKAWGQPVTTRDLIHMFKEAGFGAIRVPVTWYPHMEAKFSFTGNDSYWYPSKDDIGFSVNAKWMARVKEIVDYVIDEGMYCILNVHHDTGAANTAWINASEASYEKSHERFERLWSGIAGTFRNYDEHLLFESFNEMLDDYDSWCFASFATSNKYDGKVASSAYKAINSYAQSFVNAVRRTGGNNAHRNLIINTYGACSGSGNWSNHLQDPLKEMQLPDDTAEGQHIIFEVHSYPNISNLSSAKNEVKDMLKGLQTHLISKGAPVIIGEWGTSETDSGNDYKNNRTNMTAFAKDFVQQAKSYDVATFYWMGLSDAADRTALRWTQPEIKDAIITGYYGEDGYDDAIRLALCEEDDDTLYFDLCGRPVVHPTPGIYIHRGRKVRVK